MNDTEICSAYVSRMRPIDPLFVNELFSQENSTIYVCCQLLVWWPYQRQWGWPYSPCCLQGKWCTRRCRPLHQTAAGWWTQWWYPQEKKGSSGAQQGAWSSHGLWKGAAQILPRLGWQWRRFAWCHLSAFARWPERSSLVASRWWRDIAARPYHPQIQTCWGPSALTAHYPLQKDKKKDIINKSTNQCWERWLINALYSLCGII